MGKVYVVGLGPGEKSQMTFGAWDALAAADVICGYHVYVDLAAQYFPDAPTYTTPMTKETERCQWAVEQARAGKTVAMVCSGDSGVYGMAGLVLQVACGVPGVEVEVVAGITAALSGAAVLGAPLMHDACLISLSDLLTPWDKIAKRLRCAAQADFCIALYNPSSRKRADYLQRACDILLEEKPPQTVCGWVRSIGREGQESKVLTLAELREENVDMFTTVFIGNEDTRVIDGRAVTPRGYEKKHALQSAAGGNLENGEKATVVSSPKQVGWGGCR